jgi:uracil phosphoribosyltransferase
VRRDKVMLTALNHPLITHKLTLMGNKDTGTKDFRENLNEIGYIVSGLGDAGDRIFGTK